MTHDILVNVPRHFSDERVSEIVNELKRGSAPRDANIIIEFPAGLLDVVVTRR
jgi:hypothetical protein